MPGKSGERAQKAQGGRKADTGKRTRDAILLRLARSPHVAEVRRALFERCGVMPGDAVVVAVSGGADSLALMLALAAISGRSSRSGRGVSPVVVHVHHHLRGRPADLDAEFVHRHAGRLDLPFLRRDVHPARERGSRAAAARRLRYAALAEVAAERGASAIAVAHHAEDQLETMLMALARGAGLEGLAGLAWRRSVAEGTAHAGIAIVRPMLGLRREACEGICRLAGWRWRQDAGNRDLTSPRVRLRRQVLPVLEDLWSGAAARSVATGDLLRAAWAMAERSAPALKRVAAGVVLDRENLLAVPPLVAGIALRNAVEALREEPLRCSGSGGEGVQREPEGPSHHQIELALRVVGSTRAKTSLGTSLDWLPGLRLRVSPREVAIEPMPHRSRRSIQGE